MKLRTPDFYAPDRSEKELHDRENSFVSDSIRAAHQYHRESIIPRYEALDDPHLRQFFQSPVVLDVVRKTLNRDSNSSYKRDDSSSKMSMNKTRSRSVREFQVNHFLSSCVQFISRMIHMKIVVKIIIVLSRKVHPVIRD